MVEIQWPSVFLGFSLGVLATNVVPSIAFRMKSHNYASSFCDVCAVIFIALVAATGFYIVKPENLMYDLNRNMSWMMSTLLMGLASQAPRFLGERFGIKLPAWCPAGHHHEYYVPLAPKAPAASFVPQCTPEIQLHPGGVNPAFLRVIASCERRGDWFRFRSDGGLDTTRVVNWDHHIHSWKEGDFVKCSPMFGPAAEGRWWKYHLTCEDMMKDIPNGEETPPARRVRTPPTFAAIECADQQEVFALTESSNVLPTIHLDGSMTAVPAFVAAHAASDIEDIEVGSP